jgi:hypothetical protein
VNAPRPDTVAEPDPEEPVQRWEVTGCANCGRTIWRPIRRAAIVDWRHVSGYESCRDGWRP